MQKRIPPPSEWFGILLTFEDRPVPDTAHFRTGPFGRAARCGSCLETGGAQIQVKAFGTGQ